MQVYSISRILKCTQLIHISYKIIQYLDQNTLLNIIHSKNQFNNQSRINRHISNHQINNIYEAQKKKDRSQNHQEKCKEEKSQNQINQLMNNEVDIMQLIATYYYINYGLNKVDRSLYYNLYDDQQFKNIECLLIQKIVTQSVFHEDLNIDKTIKEFSNNSKNKKKNFQIDTKSLFFKTTTPNTNQINFNKNKSPIIQFSTKVNQQNSSDNLNNLVNLNNLNRKSFHTLTNFIKLFDKILEEMKQEIEINDDEIEEIKRIFLDPSLPLPKMKRQNQGIYCNSPFQLFLVGLRFKHQNLDDFSFFQNLQQLLNDNEQTLLKSFFQIQRDKYMSPRTYQKLHFIRYTSYEITQHNYSSLKLQKHSLHNLIVLIFVMTDIYITSIKQYIQMIDDPMYMFVELMCRYSVFRSLIMEIEVTYIFYCFTKNYQENLGFIFEMYDTLYSDSIRDSVSNKPKFCFWRPAMSKWYQKMNQIHQKTNMIYFMLLTKIRQDNILTLFEKYPLLKQSEITIKNKLEMNDLLYCLKEDIKKTSNKNFSKNNYYFKASTIYFNFHPHNSLLSQFLSSNLQLYEILTCEYVEYMIDLAIDEYQVHWCGHSQQRLQKNYYLFQDEFLQYNQNYIKNLNKIIKVSKSENENELDMKLRQIIIQEDINLLQEKYVKPITLKCVLEQINSQNFKIYSDQFLEVTPISLDFTFKDSNLKYYNEKAHILREVSQQDKCYFSIPPLLSPEQILIKSIDTTDSDRHYQGNEDDDKKVSDEEDQNRNKRRILKNKRIKKNSFQYVSDAEEQDEQNEELLCISKNLIEEENREQEQEQRSVTEHQSQISIRKTASSIINIQDEEKEDYDSELKNELIRKQQLSDFNQTLDYVKQLDEPMNSSKYLPLKSFLNTSGSTTVSTTQASETVAEAAAEKQQTENSKNFFRNYFRTKLKLMSNDEQSLDFTKNI